MEKINNQPKTNPNCLKSVRTYSDAIPLSFFNIIQQ